MPHHRASLVLFHPMGPGPRQHTSSVGDLPPQAYERTTTRPPTVVLFKRPLNSPLPRFEAQVLRPVFRVVQRHRRLRLQDPGDALEGGAAAALDGPNWVMRTCGGCGSQRKGVVQRTLL